MQIGEKRLSNKPLKLICDGLSLTRIESKGGRHTLASIPKVRKRENITERVDFTG